MKNTFTIGIFKMDLKIKSIINLLNYFNPFLHDFLFLTGKKSTSLKLFPDYGKNNKKNFKFKVWKL